MTVAAEQKLSPVIKLTRELFVLFLPNILTLQSPFEIKAGTTPIDLEKQNMQRHTMSHYSSERRG